MPPGYVAPMSIVVILMDSTLIWIIVRNISKIKQKQKRIVGEGREPFSGGSGSHNATKRAMNDHGRLRMSSQLCREINGSRPF